MWRVSLRTKNEESDSSPILNLASQVKLEILAAVRKNFPSLKRFKNFSMILSLLLAMFVLPSVTRAKVAPLTLKKSTTALKERFQSTSNILAELKLPSSTFHPMNLKIRLQPKQSKLWDFWDTQKQTRLGMGGARGGSKSGGGRRLMLLRRFTYPNTTGLILRRTYPSLYKSHLVKLFEEYPELRVYWREGSKELLLPNGSRLFFDSAPTEKELANYYSGEFADIMLDEAQEFSQAEIEKLSGSNRCTSNDKITCAMLFTFMPGVSEEGLPPRGLDYLRRVFVERNLRDEEKQHSWAFVQAFAWDNIEWARKALNADGVSEQQFYSWPDEQRREYFVDRTEFGHQLRGLTNQALRDAWLYGKWDVFQGQYFPNFDYERHTKPASEIKLETWWRRWISGDWGHDHPACIHLHCEDDNEHIYTYAELWGREIGETELGRRIGAMCGEYHFSEFWLSWDAFGKLNKTTRKSIVEMISDAMPENLPKPIPADSSPGSRISGWRLMHQLLDQDRWTISRDCPKLIECIPTLVRDMERNTEDVLKVDYSENYIGDDAADSARYGLQNVIMPATEPFELTAIREIEKVPQGTERLMKAMKVLHKGPQIQTLPIKRRRYFVHS